MPRASAQRGGSAIGLPSEVWIAQSGAIGPTLSARHVGAGEHGDDAGELQPPSSLSMLRMRAWACGERTSTQCNSPGSVMSAT